MKEYHIKVKYDIGDRVWIMENNYPQCHEIKQIRIIGCTIDKDGETSNFGVSIYKLDNNLDFRENELCDTFEELRDKVFDKEFKKNIPYIKDV